MNLAIDLVIDGTSRPALARSLQSLQLTESHGDVEDSATIVLGLPPRRLTSIPRRGVRLAITVAMGERPAVPLGHALYVTAVAGDDQAGTVTIEAASVPPASPLHAPRDASWHEHTVGAIASAIASRAGWTAAVAPALATIEPSNPLQSGESDLQFLRRLVRRLGGRLVIQGDHLVVVDDSSAQSAIGRPLPAVTLGPRDLWASWRLSERPRVASVEASYLDEDGAIDKVAVGEGQPLSRLPGVYNTAAEATAAAKKQARRAADAR